MSNVINISKKEGLEPDELLEKCKGQYSHVLVIGYDNDGRLLIHSSSKVDHETCLWFTSMFTKKLLDGDYF